MTPLGYQSGYTAATATATLASHNDDSFPSTFVYDSQHNLIYFTGVTYSTYFDKATNLPPNVLGAMGMSMTSPSEEKGSRDDEYHLTSGDCFLGILKLPPPTTAANANSIAAGGHDAKWWKNNNSNQQNSQQQAAPKLIYAKRFGTPQNSEACSSLLTLPHVNDALLHSSNQLKLVLLGHVNPEPLSEVELEQLREKLGGSGGSGGSGEVGSEFDVGGGGNNGGRRLEQQKQVEETTHHDKQTQQQQQQQQQQERPHQQQEQEQEQNRSLEQPEINQGGFFTSLSHNSPSGSGSGGGGGGNPLTHNGRAYGFLIDFDISLTPNEEFEIETSSPTAPIHDLDMNNAYGALLGGYVLESSPLVYPIDLTQNLRDPNQLYVVSMHSDNENEVYNPEYVTSAEEEVNVELHSRPDVTLGAIRTKSQSRQSTEEYVDRMINNDKAQFLHLLWLL